MSKVLDKWAYYNDVELYDIAVMARKKFGIGMYEPNLIRATDQEDGG